MLTNLHVKNLALIEEAEVEFAEGLNILTGETGAGKSILLGAVNLALGAKFEKEMLRHGEKQALVELTFQGEKSKKLQDIFQKEEIPLEVEEDILISRRMEVGKSVYRINGEVVVARVVKAVAEELIDIHGQHEHQSLLKKAKHLEILDEYAGEKIQAQTQALSVLVQEGKKLKKQIEELSMDESAKKREQDLLLYEIEEIENASLKIGEDEELENSYRRMGNSSKLSEAAGEVSSLLEDDRTGAAMAVSKAVRSVRGLASLDEKMGDLESQLLDIEALLSDLQKDVEEYLESLEWDEEEYQRIQDRLNEINRLKDKYGRDIPTVLKELDIRKNRIQELENMDETLIKIQKELSENYEKQKELAEKISEIRKKAAKELEKVLTKALLELNFLTVHFEIAIHDNEEITAKGKDDVEFMISTNPGEEVRGLGMVASGGELSRIMLAIKTVLAGKDDIDTLIFDEIDTGISGKTAYKVAEALAQVAKKHQVLCITHLPQIASMADEHYVIEKKALEDGTVTCIRGLSEEESLEELGRLLGMDETSESAIQNAREMKEQSRSRKNHF